jgi:hypothetical protein
LISVQKGERANEKLEKSLKRELSQTNDECVQKVLLKVLAIEKVRITLIKVILFYQKVVYDRRELRNPFRLPRKGPQPSLSGLGLKRRHFIHICPDV